MLKELVRESLRDALKRIGIGEDIPIEVEAPGKEDFGDLSSNVAFNLKLGIPPREAAQRVIANLDLEPFQRVELAGPGFINFFLKQEAILRALAQVLRAGEDFGPPQLGEGQRVQVEYGSANPTGPLHIGFGRNVVLGDTLANMLAAVGYNIQREYYVNDAGTQVELFARSLYIRYAEALGQEAPIEFPEQGYQGQYITDWAYEIAEAEGDKYLKMPAEEGIEAIGRVGLEQKVLSSVRADVEALDIHYDHWFSEHILYEKGTVDKVMTILRRGGNLTERDGAVWFTATKFGVDKDEVLVRSSGQPGYFASDIAYHYNKFVERGFDWVIDIWGADHQGHVPRMKAMMKALGLEPKRLTPVVYQLVTLKKGGEEVRLSKRSGEMITLHELIEEVGRDAMRFFLLSRSADTHLDFDLELAKRQSKENPVYYIQYAHTRIAGIERELKGKDSRFKDWEKADLGPLKEKEELDLIQKLDEFPEVLRDAAVNFAPHLLAAYTYELAALFHGFYDRYRVISDDAESTLARLALCKGVQLVLRKALNIMGVSAPERM